MLIQKTLSLPFVVSLPLNCIMQPQQNFLLQLHDGHSAIRSNQFSHFSNHFFGLGCQRYPTALVTLQCLSCILKLGKSVVNCEFLLCSITVYLLHRTSSIPEADVPNFTHELVLTHLKLRYCSEWLTLMSDSNGTVMTMHNKSCPDLLHPQADM
jgi:hypothetical protein